MSATLEQRLATARLAFAGGEDPGRVVFSRTCLRAARLKRLCDCGHWVDGSRDRDQIYRYQVWKLPGTSGVEQRTDCEPCARVDVRC